MALEQPRPRILIADGVSLGKTLEVGILLAELIARGRASRILVVALKSILRQFQEELWARFTIPLVRLDSVGIQRVQSKIPSNANPFHYFPRVIISIDTLKKDEKYRRYLEDTHWDVVVVDECQHVAERSQGGGRRMARRANLARMLARTCDALVMTSATPHDGKPESFASLMNLLEPTAIADPTNYARDDIQGRFVRRFKKDVAAEAGAHFRDRRVHLEELPAAAAENVVFETLESLEFRTVDHRGVSGDGVWFRTVLLKSFLSSPTACARTIEARLEHDRLQGDDLGAEHDRSALSTLLEQVRAVTPERFTKLRGLLAWLAELGYSDGECGDRVVVFSERIDTLKFLQQEIADRFKLRAESIGLFYGSLEDQKQPGLVHEFGTKDSRLRILLASDASSQGINLHHYCHRLIQFDVPWSLIRMEQRNGHLDRYGQEETPDIRSLLTVPERGELKGDLRVLEVLVEKEGAAHRNIGDVAWLMQLHDAELEEARVAQAIQDHEAPERIIDEPAGPVDWFAVSCRPGSAPRVVPLREVADAVGLRSGISKPGHSGREDELAKGTEAAVEAARSHMRGLLDERARQLRPLLEEHEQRAQLWATRRRALLDERERNWRAAAPGGTLRSDLQRRLDDERSHVDRLLAERKRWLADGLTAVAEPYLRLGAVLVRDEA